MSASRGLAAFFDAAALLHSGQLTLQAFADRLGAPATPGLATQQRLCEQASLRLLEDLFPVVRRAVGEGWEALARAYLSAHPSRHWDVNQLGNRLPAFVASRPEPWLAELADLQLADLKTQLSPEAFDPSRQRVNPTLSVRHYRHDVLGYALDPDAALPRPGPVTLLIFREPSRLAVRFHRPTEAELLAVLLETGDVGREAAPAEAVLEAARGSLRRLGVLGR